MHEYSVELKNNIEKICDYYAENETFDFLRKIIDFMMECVSYYIPEKYFVIPKKYIATFTKDAMKIWEKDGQEKELSQIRALYMNRMTEIKPLLAKCRVRKIKEDETTTCNNKRNR